MNNYFKKKLRDRLIYCREWKHSIDLYLTNKEITKKADDEYYKSKPFLKMILDVYFIPYNLIQFLKYLRIIHEYKKNQVEIRILSRELSRNEDYKK